MASSWSIASCCWHQEAGGLISPAFTRHLVAGHQPGWEAVTNTPNLSPKTLNCKGKDVENVFTIRTPEDANRVVRLARGRNAVVVGAGFLGE